MPITIFVTSKVGIVEGHTYCRPDGLWVAWLSEEPDILGLLPSLGDATVWIGARAERNLYKTHELN